MTKSTLILLCIALTIGIAFLTLAASSQCTSCMKEGDWGQSAKNFIEGKPIDDTPKAFGPKAERETSSQSTSDKANIREPLSDTSDSAATKTQGAGIKLVSIDAKPNPVTFGKPVEIVAAFQERSLAQSENRTDADNNGTSAVRKETLLTVTASISDTNGTEVGKADLVKSSENEYSGVWNDTTLAGIYNVTLTASSRQSLEVFSDVLQIEVIGNDNVSSSSAPKA
jgi:hypothetical protein